nr:leucine zipper domain-containing protein [Streptomyces sp. NEAU-YJ-81]
MRLARCVIEDGWPLRRAAERFQVSHTTAARWAHRCRHHGAAGLSDRSSRPHHSPRRTPAPVEEQVLRMRREHHIVPLRLAGCASVAASTAHRILQRHGLPPLATLDWATAEPVRRPWSGHAPRAPRAATCWSASGPESSPPRRCPSALAEGRRSSVTARTASRTRR